jgi:hypothetical protein
MASISRAFAPLMCLQTVIVAFHDFQTSACCKFGHTHRRAAEADMPILPTHTCLESECRGQPHRQLPAMHACVPYAALTLTRNSSTALRSMPDCVSSSRALASTSDAALPVAAAAVVTPPIWAEISLDPAATD